MSEDKFKEAKGQLGFSQQLRDKLNKPPEMPQNEANVEDRQNEMPQESQMDNPEQASVKQPQEDQKSIVDAVKEAIQPMVNQIKEIFSAKKDEPQKVELKIDGEMKSKE